jgi:ABC-type lipoprotein export system ATPase subunit
MSQPGLRLTVDGVAHQYGGLAVLRNITLAAEPGEVMVLGGPSGCGKSTLLGIMGGVLAPASGVAQQIEQDLVRLQFLPLLRFNVVDRVLDGGDFLSRVLGDFNVELFFERHHQLDRVEAIGAQVVDEGRFRHHSGFIHAKVVRYDPFDLYGNVTHRLPYS